MKTILVVAALLCAGCASSRQHFYLRSAQSGMLIEGRFLYRDGTYVPPSDWGFLIDQPRPGEMATIDRLKSTVLKEVEFSQATVTQVVAAVNEMQKSQLGQLVVPIAVDLKDYRQFVGGGIQATGRTPLRRTGDCLKSECGRSPPFTGSYRHISLFELLRMVSIITWLPMNIDDASVTLSQRPFRKAASNNAPAWYVAPLRP
jgi:hypothetical protein